MHESEMYSPEAKEVKLIRLIAELRKGTELEGLNDGLEYNIIEERILSTIKELAQHLWEDSIIVLDTGRYCQSKIFSECWKNRKTYWNLATSTKEVVTETAKTTRNASSLRAVASFGGNSDGEVGSGLFLTPEPNETAIEPTRAESGGSKVCLPG